jgi:hypothetical protein
MALDSREQIPYKTLTLTRDPGNESGPDPRWTGADGVVRIQATQSARDESWNVVVHADGGKVSAVAVGSDRDAAADAAVAEARDKAQAAFQALNTLAARAR